MNCRNIIAMSGVFYLSYESTRIDIMDTSILTSYRNDSFLKQPLNFRDFNPSL